MKRRRVCRPLYSGILPYYIDSSVFIKQVFIMSFIRLPWCPPPPRAQPQVVCHICMRVCHHVSMCVRVCVPLCVQAHLCARVCVVMDSNELFRDHITLVRNHITIVRAHVIFVEVLPFYVVTMIWVRVLRMVCRLAVSRAVSIFSAIRAALAPAFAFSLKMCRYAFQNEMHVWNTWKQMGE